MSDRQRSASAPACPDQMGVSRVKEDGGDGGSDVVIAGRCSAPKLELQIGERSVQRVDYRVDKELLGRS